MSLQNEMRRVKKTNLEYTAKRLRADIESLCTAICINLDCGLASPEALPIDVVDSQFDALKCKWTELVVAIEEIKRVGEELR